MVDELSDEQPKPITLRTLQRWAEAGQKFAVLTCYDATTAKWLDRAGVPVILVGDTAAEMVLGYESTIHAPLDFMVQITAAVKRGAPRRFVMADMPFMSYQTTEAEAVRNAGCFLTEGMADAVKLEVDADDAQLVARLSHAGIPVVAHLGSRPQQVRRSGGYRSAGKTADAVRALVAEAEEMEAHGAVMLLLEATTAEASEAIARRVSLPVIGCGAGPACDGHVVVLHDLLGLSDWQPPFAPPLAQLGASIREAAAQWAQRVNSGQYSSGAHPYGMDPSERGKLSG